MIALIGSVSVVIAVLLYAATLIPRDEKGAGYWDMLRLFIVLFCMTLLLLIPKAALDSMTVCEVVPSSSVVSGGTTNYTFTDFCYARSEGSALTFYRATLWFVRIYWAAVLIFLVIETVRFIGRVYKR